MAAAGSPAPVAHTHTHTVSIASGWSVAQNSSNSTGPAGAHRLEIITGPEHEVLLKRAGGLGHLSGSALLS